MKIIDAHLHFVPENPYFQEIAVRAEHKNTEEDLRAVYQKYNIEGGVVMGNRGVDPVLSRRGNQLSGPCGSPQAFCTPLRDHRAARTPHPSHTSCCIRDRV